MTRSQRHTWTLQPLSSPPRLLCRSPGPGASVASLRCLNPRLSRVFKLTPAHNYPHTVPHTHITDHRRHRTRRPDSRVRTTARAVAVSTGASTRVCGAPSAGRPRRRHGPATAAAAGAAARRRGHSRATEPAARMCGYAAPRVPSPSSERRGAGRRRARASAALLLLQARRAAPAATPRRLSLGGVEVGRARSRGRGGRH